MVIQCFIKVGDQQAMQAQAKQAVNPVLFSELPGNDPIFIGINRLAAKGLNKDERWNTLVRLWSDVRKKPEFTNNGGVSKKLHSYA